MKNGFSTERAREALKATLRSGIVFVTFTKTDGSERVMRCTQSLDTIEACGQSLPKRDGESPRPKRLNPDICCVWDLDNVGWRSFRFDSIKETRSE